MALGAAVQGAVGYGMALVAAPILALIDPTLVPVPMIILASVHSVLAVVRDGRHADWRGVGWAMLGRLPGTALGVLVVLTPVSGSAVQPATLRPDDVPGPSGEVMSLRDVMTNHASRAGFDA